jgi:hypothetical protein
MPITPSAGSHTVRAASTMSTLTSAASSVPTGAPLSRPGVVPASLAAGPALRDRATAPAQVRQPEEFRFSFPRALVERLEQLERRLQKLESFPGQTADLHSPPSPSPSPNRPISSARNP